MVSIRFPSVSTCGATELSTQVALDTAPAVRTSPLAMRAGIRAANDNTWDDNRTEPGYKYGANSYSARGKSGCMGR